MGAPDLQRYPTIYLVKRETYPEALEFDQVAFAIKVLPPEIALAPVNLNRTVFAANQHVLLQ